MDDLLEIRVHDSGAGRMTDRDMERRLSNENPIALLLAQKLLSATAKQVRNKGLFSTEKSRLQKVQALCYQLRTELKKTPQYHGASDVCAIFMYMNQISNTYPNWIPEYRALNRLIPLFF